MPTVKFLVEVVSNDRNKSLVGPEEREYFIPNYSEEGINVNDISPAYRLMYCKMQYAREIQDKVKENPEIYYDLLYNPGLVKKDWRIDVIEI